MRAVLAAVLSALTAVAPALASPSLPAIHPASLHGPDTFTVILHGASHPLWGPRADPDDKAAITAVPGLLVWPTSVLRYSPQLDGIADIVVAQHDPRTVWIVAHFSGAIALPELGQTGDALTLTFHGPRAGPLTPSPHPSLPAAASPSVPSRTGADHDGLPVSRLSAHWAHVPLAQAARDITQVTGVPITLRVNPATPITLDATDVTLRTLIDMLAAAAGAAAVPSGHGYVIVPWH